MASSMRTFMFVLILLPLVVTGFVFLLYQGTQFYGEDIDPQYQDIYDDFNDSIYSNYGQTQEMQDNIYDPVSSDEGEAGLIISMFKIIKIPFQNLARMTTIISKIGSAMGLPDWVIYPILSCIIVLLLFLVITLVLRATGA